MVWDGVIPDAGLVYFFTHSELQQVINSRGATLVSKAIRRRKLHPEMNALVYPEMSLGIPKALLDSSSEEMESTVVGVELTGTPVFKGEVRAKVRVAVNLQEARDIQCGEILITRSTDIGWSPYFPLLAGVVTELGGLISHGAVVAREYVSSSSMFNSSTVSSNCKMLLWRGFRDIDDVGIIFVWGVRFERCSFVLTKIDWWKSFWFLVRENYFMSEIPIDARSVDILMICRMLFLSFLRIIWHNTAFVVYVQLWFSLKILKEFLKEPPIRTSRCDTIGWWLYQRTILIITDHHIVDVLMVEVTKWCLSF